MSPEKERELGRAMHRARTEFNSLPGPSDDSDEQTAVASMYRHLLVTIQLLASPILEHSVSAQLADLSVDTTTIHDVYDVMPKLNVLMFEIDEALRNLRPANALSRNEADRLVRNWIGVDAGYLGYPDSSRFSYPSHDDFWMNTCGVDADTKGFAGTTRECFIDTLARVSPDQQVAVLEAILERFPVIDPADPVLPSLRRPNFKMVIEGWVTRIRGTKGLGHTALLSAADEVRAALADADKLGPSRSVDRIHTAMHGYLHQLCVDATITVDSADPTMAKLLKVLRQNHPALVDGSDGAGQLAKVLQGWPRSWTCSTRFGTITHPPTRGQSFSMRRKPNLFVTLSASCFAILSAGFTRPETDSGRRQRAQNAIALREHAAGPRLFAVGGVIQRTHMGHHIVGSRS